MNHYIRLLCFFLVIQSCKGDLQKPVEIHWKKIHKMGLDPDYSYAEIIENSGILFAYSNSPASGGSYRILKQHTELRDYHIIKYSPDRVITFFTKGNQEVYFIEDNFDTKTLETHLWCVKDSSIKEVTTPITYPRTFFPLPNSWIVQGNTDGFGKIFQSKDSGTTWQAVAYYNRYKAVDLLKPIDSTTLLCLALKDGDYDNQTLATYNTQKHKFTDIHYIAKSKYISPISSNKDLHCLCLKNLVTVFELRHGYKEINTFNAPNEIDEVEMIFINNEITIVTGESYEINKKAKSWISNNGGKTWLPLAHEDGKRLLYNPNGILLMYDDKHIIHKGEYDLSQHDNH